MTLTSLSLNASDINTQGSGADGGGDDCSTAITSLGTVQGQVGQLENRLSYAISLAQSQIVNTKAAESRIRDANIAEESANLTRYNILNQSRYRGFGPGQPVDARRFSRSSGKSSLDGPGSATASARPVS